jgi:CheY-specific phosphatase CheX
MRPTERELEGELFAAATSVLEAMYFTSVLGPAEQGVEAGGWLSELEFQGELSGSFALRMGGETARMLAGNFFGEEESEVSETAIGDMVGEMANMICGSVLSRMETEMHFKLSHPSVERVEDGAEAGHGGVCQQLETDSGVLTLCLQTQ